MSSPFAIAGVTAVLKDLLNKQLAHPDLTDLSAAIGSFSVTTIAPDRITTGAQEPNQLNLFLYQVTSNQGWSNTGLPSRDNSSQRLTNPPLAIDLHYLLTAYGAQDFNDEILLGCAMQAFHETPVLSRAYIRTVLDNSVAPPKPSPFDRLSAADLADQIELIKITPRFLTTEELSKLWTAMQARFRQTMAYQVSVLLIQSSRPVKSSLPVINRGEKDRGAEASSKVSSTFPLLESIHIGPIEDANIKPLPRSYPSTQMGLQIILQGQNLNGDEVHVNFNYKPVRSAESEKTHPRFIQPGIDIQPDKRTATEIKIKLPEDFLPTTEWRAGLYTVAVKVTKGAKEHNSNELPLVLAARIDEIKPKPIVRGAGGDVTLTITCSPTVIKEQTATLLLPDREVIAASRQADTDPLVFVIDNAPIVTDAPVRLRIDGVDSIPFERIYDGDGNPQPLAFAENQKVTIT